MKSHALSGALHLCLLWIAFLAPAALVLEEHPQWLELDRTVELSERVVSMRQVPVTPRTFDNFLETAGDGEREGDGKGNAGGDRVQMRANSTPRRADRKIEAANAPRPAGLAAEVGAILDGFADTTLGPDSVTALGALDEGLGGHGRGFGQTGGGVGRGASCFGYWDQKKNGETMFVKADHCKGATIGRGMGTGAGMAAVQLGERAEVAIPTIVVGEPVGCLTAAACPWKEILRKVVQRHERELRHCYETALNKTQRAFSARVEVSFGLPPAGGTADVDLDSNSGIRSFDACVSRRVASWVFPKTGEQIRVNYPFRFATL